MRKPDYYWSNIITEDFLQKEYVEGLKCAYEIAREIGCDHAIIARNLKKYGIEKRNRKILKGKDNPTWVGCGEISGSYWCSTKSNARARKLAFEITIEEVWSLYLKQGRKCALTKRDIGFEWAKSNTASLDRIDSSLGYYLNNVQWVHKDINFAKGSLNNEAFISLCKEVADTFKNS